MASTGTDPSQPVQPPKESVYDQPPPSSVPNLNDDENDSSSNSATAHRTPHDMDQPAAVPSALDRGVRGSEPADAREAANTSVERGTDSSGIGGVAVDADQVAMAGEGDVASAVERKSGGRRQPGQEGEDVFLDGQTSELDRKKKEQAPAREAVHHAREEGYQVDGRSVRREQDQRV